MTETHLAPATGVTPAAGHHAASTRVRVRTDRRFALVAVLAIGTASGLLMAVAIPRGPTTSLAGLGVILLALAVGLASGAALRSTWAVVPAGLAQLLAFEIGRAGLDGPTVDAIRLDSSFGVIALLVGRGLHAALVLIPLLVGARIGVLAATDRLTPRSPASWGGAIVVVGLALIVAWPASTPPVIDASGSPIPGSIATLETVSMGGSDQTIMIRAADPTKPVLLFLSGGPGQSDLALARASTTGWVDDLVFVDWDQRGNGTSYAAIDPLSSMTLDQAVADTISLSEYLRDRFEESKIYLMGESWGTILGVLAVQQRPDLFHAWIGSGQMVDVRETDRRIYADLVALAARTGDEELAAGLAAIGEPPYRDIPFANGQVMVWYDRLYDPYTPSAGYIARGDASGLDPFGVLGSEYTLVDKANVLRGLMDTFAVMYPQLQGLDLRQVVPSLEVPVVVLDGAAELDGRRDLALSWFDALDAPSKQLVTYDDAAHAVAFEQADEVERLLVDTIFPATYTRGDAP
jgi:proline iminopeptidase